MNDRRGSCTACAAPLIPPARWKSQLMSNRVRSAPATFASPASVFILVAGLKRLSFPPEEITMRRLLCLPVLLVCLTVVAADDKLPPLLFEDNFSNGADRWEPRDAKIWKVIDADGGKAYSLFSNKTEFKPMHRSPFLYSLIKDATVGDFILDVKCKSTIKDYPHRDLCFVFGHQDNDHYYYTHLGRKADDHANQIFIVNGADRTKISTKTTEGTPWTDNWHHVKVVRKVADGTIQVFFEDMKTPAQIATDKTFIWGRVGVGSFDDIGDFREVKLYGVKAEKK
jgi:hypothetical protein